MPTPLEIARPNLKFFASYGLNNPLLPTFDHDWKYRKNCGLLPPECLAEHGVARRDGVKVALALGTRQGPGFEAAVRQQEIQILLGVGLLALALMPRRDLFPGVPGAFAKRRTEGQNGAQNQRESLPLHASASVTMRFASATISFRCSALLKLSA